MGKRRATVAAQHRRGRSGKRLQSAPERRKSEQPLTPQQRRRMVRIFICGGLFVLLVAVKLLFPETMKTLRIKASGLLERNMDVQAVLSALGRGFSGEEDSIAEEVYQAVFGAEKAEEHTPQTIRIEAAPELALELLHASLPEPASEEETQAEVLYCEENLPEGVSMQQAILGFSYCTPVVGTLTSRFGYREHPVDGEDTFHYGVDLAAATGTEVLSFAGGTVGAVGESSSYGNYCTIHHEDGYTTLYAHCDRILTRSGAEVKRGEVIARVGSTGVATGSHLHFELLRDGVYLNPIYYIETTL